VKQLQDSVFQDKIDTIKFRRVTKSNGCCIDFHLDYSLKTMQIFLNCEEEYQGGRLIYAHYDKGFLSPSRLLGCATIHDNNIVHGVTALESGIRYSLFCLRT